MDDDTYPNIFIIGDAADTGDLKMAYKATLHAAIVAKNIQCLLNKSTPKAKYSPSTSELMVLPLGKTGGLSYLSFFGGMFLLESNTEL